jgi:hypothetical protein
VVRASFDLNVSSVRVRVPQGAVNAWAADQNGPVFDMLDSLATEVQFGARRRVGFHTGRLHNSIRKQRRVGTTRHTVAVVAGLGRYTPYLGYHMGGTPPHEIRPRRRKALRWIDAGGVRFATRVRHPGTAPNPFLTDALDALTL